jgi:hypothetical protein
MNTHMIARRAFLMWNDPSHNLRTAIANEDRTMISSIRISLFRNLALVLLILAVASGTAYAGNILLVADEEGLWAGDSVMIDLAEELGHTVTVATPPVTAAQADGMDLVLISSTYQPDLDEDFRDVEVPVLIWNPYEFSKLSMVEDGSESSAPSETTLTITTPSHDMAAGLSGDVKVQSCCYDIDYAELSPSAQIAAVRENNDSSYSAIWGFETGAEMAYEFEAPARRAGTFVYNDGPTMLTTAGRNLVKAAITWTMSGSGGGPSSPPVVEITYPAEGAIIHETSTAVSWKVDGVTQTSDLTEALSVGTNRIIRSATNGAGTTHDTVTVTRSTDPPVVSIVYPTQSLEVFSSPVPVTWTVDGVTQATGTSESLSEGINTITRQCMYNGGTQSVSASVQVYLDTQPATCLGP